jgi:hypothetical protein
MDMSWAMRASVQISNHRRRLVKSGIFVATQENNPQFQSFVFVRQKPPGTIERE